jgi:hydrogenase expression/formation protein HypE
MSQETLSMRLQCPMPTLDFDVITIGHGSGGLLTHKLLDSGVFQLFDNTYLQDRHDGVILNLDRPAAFTTDSFVVSPIFFPGGNIGELAVNGTVNDLAMCGAEPRFLSLSFILEEGLRMEEFWEVLVGVKHAADQAGVQIVTGDTKVVEKGKGDKVFVNTTGIGLQHPKARISSRRIKAGDRILVSGNLATHGVAILSVRQGLEFETDICSDTRSLHRPVLDALDQLGEEVHLLRDPTRGGVATVLNEVCRDIRLGVDLDQRKLPLDEQVEGACELLGLDPLYVANEGIFLMFVAEQAAEKALEILRSHPEGRQASVIGKVVHDHPGQVVLRSAIGGRRVVNMLAGEQLPRIC